MAQSVSGKSSDFCIEQEKNYSIKLATRYANEINNDLKKTAEQVESIVLSLEDIYANKDFSTGKILPLPEMKEYVDENDRKKANSCIFSIDLKNSTKGKYLSYNLMEYNNLSKKSISIRNIGDLAAYSDEQIKEMAKRNAIVSSNYAPKEIENEMKLISNVDSIVKPMYCANLEIEIVCIATKKSIGYSFSSFNDYLRYLPLNRNWYKDAVLNPDNTVWQGTYVSLLSGKNCITCSKAFKDTNGNILGVAAIDMRLDKINENVSNAKLGENGYAFILDKNGKVLACKDYEKANVEKEPLKNENLDKNYKDLVREIISKKTGVKISYIPFFSKDYLISFAPLESTSWILCIAVPLSNIESINKDIKENITSSIKSSVENLKNKDKSKLGFYGILFLVLLSISCLLALVLSKFIVGPLLKLSDSVKNIGGGNFENKVYIDSKDEVGQLAKEFNKMADNLKDYVKKLEKTTVEKVKLNSELNVAKTIQEDMLPCIFPKFSNQKAYDVFATMKPAKAVGGDFYDFFLVNKNHLALVIADVSGKSISAALFMVITKTLIKNYACLGFSPKEVFNVVNKRLCENNKAEMFVTSFIAIVDLKTGEVNCCNAGHNKPLIYKSESRQCKWLNTKHGFVLAGIDTVKYKEEKFILNPGDALYLYTDGVTEAVNNKKELYSDDRLIGTLNALNIKNLSSECILKNIQKSVDSFVGKEPQADDITMLMFKFFGE